MKAQKVFAFKQIVCIYMRLQDKNTSDKKVKYNIQNPNI